MFKRADNKDVRVIPAFAESGVREDEANGLLEAQQPSLVTQNQVVCVHVICFARRFSSSLNFGIEQPVGFFIYGKVTIVGLAGINSFQISIIWRFFQRENLVEPSIVLF